MKHLLLLFCIAYSPLCAQDINQGLVAHWLMNDEDEIIDQSTSMIDGIVGGGAFTEDRFGEEDEAIFFDGEFDFVVFDDVLNEVTTAEDATFSISLWHRTSDVLPDLSPLICKYAHSLCGETERQWALLIASGEGVRFYYASTPDNGNYRSVSTLDAVAQVPNTWYHIVATYNGAQDGNDGQDRVQLYVDHVLQADTLNFTVGELGETITEGYAPIGLMSYVSTDEDACGAFNAPGALDDVRIYDRVISEEEVELLFLEGVPLSVSENQAFSNVIQISPTVITNQNLRWRNGSAISDMSIEILNLEGEVVMSGFAKQGLEQNIELGGIAVGPYLVIFRTEEGLLTTKKIIVQ